MEGKYASQKERRKRQGKYKTGMVIEQTFNEYDPDNIIVCRVPSNKKRKAAPRKAKGFCIHCGRIFTLNYHKNVHM